MKNKKGFTLIELIAVLVILAILALIATPLVLNAVKNAKDAANKRSIDAYGKSVELAIASYLLDKGDFPANINDLTIEYSGSAVVCGVSKLNEDSSVYLSECTVGGKEVKDSSTDDGWYHYGKTNKTTYKSYKVGDEVTYNGMNFYVIANSDENSDSVTMLKSKPIMRNEIDLSGLENKTQIQNSTNNYNDDYIHMQYMYKADCVSAGNTSGCSSEYSTSSIKQLVEAWSNQRLNQKDLKVDLTGYSARLLTFEELTNNLGYHTDLAKPTWIALNAENTPNWVYNSTYGYYTMSLAVDSTSIVWYVNGEGALSHSYVSDSRVVRPVVTLSKEAI